jgi:amino acid adenylation domain-containing protein
MKLLSVNTKPKLVAVDYDPFTDRGCRLTAVDYDPFANGELLLTAPTTASQQEIWLVVQMGDAANCSYNESQSLRLSGELDLIAIKAALQQLVQRHEALRTSFSGDGQTLCITAELDLEILVTDLTELEPEAQAAAVTEILAAEVQQPFDVKYGPLFRSRIIKLADREHLLSITAHHLICDGWSWGVLNTDLGQLYSALCQGIEPNLAVADRLSDYALSQAAECQSLAAITTAKYWLAQFAGDLPVVDFPTDRTRPPIRTFNVAREDWHLSPELITQLQQLGTKFGCSFTTMMLAGFEVWLHRMTGQADLVVGVPAAGQVAAGQANLVGHCVNLLPLRTQIDRAKSFADYLQIRRSTILDAYEHQQFTFGSLVSKLALPRDASRVPLVPIVFNLDRGLASESVTFGGLDLEFRGNPHAFGNFELFVNVTELRGQIRLECQYNTALFDPVTIRQRMAELETLLFGIVANPHRPISQLPLLTATAQQQLITRNQTQTDYPRDLSIQQVFERQVELSPTAIAIVFAGVAARQEQQAQLTYRELNNRANQLAHHLQTLGVKAEVCVGICVERSIEMIVGMMAILKAGGAYVPLDPTYPQERLSLILTDTQAPIVLIQQHLLDRLPPHAAQLVALDREAEIWTQQSTENLSSQSSATNLAYVMYTSGSTGQPKGVSILHRGVVRLVKEIDYASFTAADVCLHLAPISFDASTLEFWSALLNGGKLVIFPPHQLSLAELGQIVKQHQVTTLLLTAGLFQLVVDRQIEILAPLSKLLTGGDVMSVAHAQKFLDTFPNCQLINVYGPTENTTFTTCALITAPLQLGASMPIGWPIANTQVYILDEQLQPLPDGVAGELYTGGDGLARGYFNRPELTAEKFVPHPFNPDPDARLYRTGDLARYLPDGAIEFLGRIDNQVKINGFRIELGEIETVLSQHPAISQTVVIVREDRPSDKRLVAYYVAKSGSQPNTSELRDFIAQRVPNYLIPAVFVLLSALPMTTNSKIDRRALPAPEDSHQPRANRFIAPRSELEIQLTKIWRKVLGLNSIGIRDNFFELGGNSLIAVRLFVEIEQIWERNLPLATLFQAQTIESLADVLLQQAWTAPWSPLVPIQTNGSQPPLFFVHSVGGNILEYYQIAHYLGQEQPVYALQSLGLDGQQEPLTCVEEMASRYIQEIQTIQPQGPYFLAGYSFGGLIVYEIAQQLSAQGQKVDLLALLDTNHPNLVGIRPPVSKAIQLHFYHLRQLELPKKIGYIRDRFDYYTDNSSDREKLVKSFAKANALTPKYLKLLDINLAANQKYITQRYPGKITLFRSQVQDLKIALSPDLGWHGLAIGGLEIQHVPGDHFGLLKEPYVRVTAQKLQSCLQQFQPKN